MRRAIVGATCAAFGLFAFSAVFGVSASPTLSVAVAIATAVAAGFLLLRPGWVEVDPRSASRPLAVLAALVALVALAALVRLTGFMVDSGRVSWSWLPASAWEVRHSCLSSYYVAAENIGTVDNIYDNALYSAPDDDPAKVRKPLRLGVFDVDVYEYPPPFLLLPRLLLPLAGSFDGYRALWFGLTGIFLLAAMIAVLRSLPTPVATRAWLLAPLFWVSAPNLGTLQKGNVQMAIVAASTLAWLAFARRRDAVGGALLAFSTASKLFPGLLGVVLLARARYKALAWTAGFGLLFVALPVVFFGWKPYEAFFHHLPGLVSGEAFPAFRNPAATAINASIPGLVFKLKLFGVPGMGFPAAKVVGWLYTVIALVFVWRAGRRTIPASDEALLALAVIVVASLRSPFLPQGYATLPPIWLFTLYAARRPLGGARLAACVATIVALSFTWPTDWPMDPRLLAALNAVPQFLAIGIGFAALREVGRSRAPSVAA